MSTFAAELTAIERGALVRPLPDLTTLVVTGAERQTWLAGLVTCDLKPLRAGQGAYGLVVNKTGRLQAEVWIALDGMPGAAGAASRERILVGARADLAPALRAHLDGYLVMEDAELAADDGFAWWIAHGPSSEAVAQDARRLGGVGALGRLAEIPTALCAVPKTASPNLGEELTRSGAVLATPRGWERARIERLLPRFGVDFDVGIHPQEASLESLAVSFTKGCYVGQEAVFMLEKRGHVAKRLVRLVTDGPADIAPGAEVSADGAKVGAVTSAIADDGKVFALASVKYKYTESGTRLAVGGHQATVSCLATRECG